MTHQEEGAATDRLRRALRDFQSAQILLLAAERKLKGLPVWAGPGERIEQHVQTTAAELVEAFKAYSATGQVASAADRHLVTEAQRHLAERRG